jgi:hypothetical protein
MPALSHGLKVLITQILEADQHLIDKLLGSVDIAWALQYWPSARQFTSDVINLSADYKGTQFLNAFCLLPLCQDSLWQQRVGSNFIATLRNGGGSSAYVPTTSIMIYRGCKRRWSYQCLHSRNMRFATGRDSIPA